MSDFVEQFINIPKTDEGNNQVLKVLKSIRLKEILVFFEPFVEFSIWSFSKRKYLYRDIESSTKLLNQKYDEISKNVLNLKVKRLCPISATEIMITVE